MRVRSGVIKNYSTPYYVWLTTFLIGQVVRIMSDVILFWEMEMPAHNRRKTGMNYEIEGTVRGILEERNGRYSSR